MAFDGRRGRFWSRPTLRVLSLQTRGMTEFIPTVKMTWNYFFCDFCVFGNTILYKKNFKILFGENSPPYRSTYCVQISWNLADEKSCVIYLTKKNKTSPGSPALATARIAPKICQGQPRRMQSECSRCRTNRFAFGERVNTVKTGRSVFTIRLKPNNKNVFSLL